MSSGAPFGAVYLKVSISVPVFGLVTNCEFDPLSLSIKRAQLLIHLTLHPNSQMRQDQAEFRLSVYLSCRYDFVTKLDEESESVIVKMLDATILLEDVAAHELYDDPNRG